MRNVMVCVTQQKNCDRLIKYGHDFLGDNEGELFIIHVAHYDFKFLGATREGDALEYLYDKALDYGANLTVVRSNNVIDTLANLVEKNNITHVVMGASREAITSSSNVIEKFSERIKSRAQLVVVPS